MAEAFLIVVAVIITIGYATLIESYRRWFLKVKPFTISNRAPSSIKFSVIIPARNEEEIIEVCLASVLAQEYPAELFEVIVVDDHSTDATSDIVRSIQKQHQNLRLIELQKVLEGKQLNSFKKKAIEYAVGQAIGDWIVTTDADCVVDRNWLKHFAAFVAENDAVFIAAPVKFKNTGSFVSIFQCLDFISLQGITAASVYNGFHTMCNGANLAYKKAVFNAVGGFAGIDNIASGDDMLLMYKVYKKYPAQVKFLLSDRAIVETLPMGSWRAFFNQRIRWASKADNFDDRRIFWVLVLVYLINVTLLILPVVAIWQPRVLLYWLILLLVKTAIELRFMYPVALFFNEVKLLKWFPVMQPVHILYTVVAGWLGKFGKYSWKGRTVR
jgi:cellulose synthase/poly-beta-1,6-N-acetylglucosamine synthase-like glycosyltransferase